MGVSLGDGEDGKGTVPDEGWAGPVASRFSLLSPRSGNILWLRVSIPPVRDAAASLILADVYGSYDLYIDGVYAGSRGISSGDRVLKAAPVLSFFPLKDSVRTRSAALRIVSHREVIGLGSSPKIGDASLYLVDSLRSSMPSVLAFALGVLVGLFCLGLWGFASKKSYLLYLGIALISMGLVSINTNLFRAVIWQDIYLWFSVGTFVYHTMIFGMLAFIGASLQRPEETLARRVAAVYAGISLILLPFELFTKLIPTKVEYLINNTLLALASVIVVRAVFLAAKGGDSKSRIILAGMGGLSLAAGLEAVSASVFSARALPLPELKLSAFGIVFFILCLSAYIARRFFETNRELETAMENVSRANRELEEKVSARTAELAAMVESLERLSREDVLTGLSNRRHGMAMLDAEVARVVRYGGDVSLALFDIDDFKRVNDRYGHPAGDAALRAVSLSVRSALRATDFVIRWGGEEFLILMTGTPLPSACVAAEKARCAVEAACFRASDGTELNVTASFGVAAFEKGCSVEDLLRRVDEALYTAKRSGKNCVAR